MFIDTFVDNHKVEFSPNKAKKMSLYIDKILDDSLTILTDFGECYIHS